MNTKIKQTLFWCAGLIAVASLSAGASELFKVDLKKHFDLAGIRTPETHYYQLVTKVVRFDLSGKPTGTDEYRLDLMWVPAILAGTDGDQFKCVKLALQTESKPSVTFPALEGWSYILGDTDMEVDEKGQLFGIEHSKFENLKNSNGERVSPETAYSLYNTFIDFHTFCHVYARKMQGGKGIEALRTIGQNLVHASAHKKIPLGFGSYIAEGSSFKIGETILEFKGVSLVNDKPSALIGYHSGESTFKMLMRPMPQMQIELNGRSLFQGDLYIDLESYWLQKATMVEHVIVEVLLPVPPEKNNAFIKRKIVLQSVCKDELARSKD